MPPFQIVGSVQVRNEDVYIEQAVLNILDFYDKIIITNHQSSVHTFEIFKHLADAHPKIELKSIQPPREAAIEPYFDMNTWIFGLDGDEMYDPQGLASMQKHLLEGAFSKDYCIFGNELNVTSLDLALRSRSIANLYKFSMSESWNNCPERLLGNDLTFKEGFNADLRRYLLIELDLEESHFRCLHMSFMKRSTAQKTRLSRTRLNPDELNRISREISIIWKLLRMAKLQVMNFLGIDWKNQKYWRGPRVEKNVAVFLRGRQGGGECF